jgi:hypothetical protein
MPSKEEILDKINKGIVIEENAVIFYTKQIESYIPKSNFNEEQRKKITAMIKILKGQSKEHKAKLENLRKKVKNA